MNYTYLYLYGTFQQGIQQRSQVWLLLTTVLWSQWIPTCQSWEPAGLGKDTVRLDGPGQEQNP